MESGQWRMDSGEWTMENGQWTMDSGQWTGVRHNTQVRNKTIDARTRTGVQRSSIFRQSTEVG
ncbi:hypothetical protein FW774_07830 [Pedobacter sp. BS3]|nr:hypothetical protein FW774_07830 [Pedobacter sp. BS3]